MKKRLFIITILNLLIVAILSLTSCNPSEAVATMPMMGNHESKMSMNPNNHVNNNDLLSHDGEARFSNTPVLANAREIVVVGNEFSFEPAEITLRKGEAVNITFINEGQLPHELSIEEFNFHLHVIAGETVRGGLIAGETDTYEIGCFIAGHYEAGMVGELTVTE